MNRYAKHKNIWNGILCVMLMTIMILTLQTTVYGASATVSISSSNVTQGDEFDVIVTIKADANIGAYNFYIDYDANVIEAVSGFEGGGNGRIQLMAYAQNTNVSTENTIKIRFKAKNPGTSTLKYISISEDNGVIDFDSADNMSVTATEGSVTVKAPYVASKNNNLSSLNVEAVKADGSTYSLDLSPKFSKDVTKYSATAVEGVKKLVVSATQEDSKASIKITGTAMDPGDNTTTITVTAEDGSTKKYVIYTDVEKAPETTTPPPEPIIVQIDGTDSYIEDINDAVALPEGFETFEYSYKDKTVVAAKGISKNLIIMYVTKGDGSAGQLYIYEGDTDTFYPMSNVQITQKLYTIVKEPADLIIPDGFVEANVTIGENTFKGWSNSDVENIYLVYAMNWNGDKGLYYYDANESQIIRYFDISVQAGVAVDDYNSLLSENEKFKDEINQLKADNNKEEAGSVTLYKNLALVCIIMAVVYLGVIIYLVARKKKDNVIDEEETEAIKEDEISEETGEIEKSEEVEESEETELAEASEVSEQPEIIEEIVTSKDEVDVAVDAIVSNIAEEIAAETIVKEEITESAIEETNTELENVTEESTIQESTIEEVAIENEETDVIVEMPAEEFVVIDDEQDEIDDMLLDFEDIITSDVESAIEEENEVSDSEIQVENVEFAEEIEPNTEIIEESQIQEEVKDISVEVSETEEPMVEEVVMDEPETEETETEEPEVEEVVVDESEIEETSSEDKKKKVAEIMEDKNSSINADDLDMVIDELFEDLFG